MEEIMAIKLTDAFGMIVTNTNLTFIGNHVILSNIDDV